MGDSWDIWTHGVSVQIENQIQGMAVQRRGWGTSIVQPANTTNWFHFAIPTPTQIDDETDIKLRSVWVKAYLGFQTIIQTVHVRVGKQRVLTVTKKFTGDVNKGGIVSMQLDLPGEGFHLKGNSGGVVICVEVKFLENDDSWVTFEGAAARFDD